MMGDTAPNLLQKACKAWEREGEREGGRERRERGRNREGESGLEERGRKSVRWRGMRRWE
jgi:hypothetical protein